MSESLSFRFASVKCVITLAHACMNRNVIDIQLPISYIYPAKNGSSPDPHPPCVWVCMLTTQSDLYVGEHTTRYRVFYGHK